MSKQNSQFWATAVDVVNLRDKMSVREADRLVLLSQIFASIVSAHEGVFPAQKRMADTENA